MDDFPTHDKFLDYQGRERTFEYTVVDVNIGYSVRARERKADGCEFAEFAIGSPFNALGPLRDKIRKRLSTRYLQVEEDLLQFSHDEVVGNISVGGVVIDDRFIPFEQLASMIQTYEGFLFELTIKDLADE